MQDGLVPVGGGKSQNGEIIITDVSCRGIVVSARARNGIAQIAFNRCDVIARYINNHTNMRIIRIRVAAGRVSGGIENPVAFLRCLRSLDELLYKIQQSSTENRALLKDLLAKALADL